MKLDFFWRLQCICKSDLTVKQLLHLEGFRGAVDCRATGGAKVKDEGHEGARGAAIEGYTLVRLPQHRHSLAIRLFHF